MLDRKSAVIELFLFATLMAHSVSVPISRVEAFVSQQINLDQPAVAFSKDDTLLRIKGNWEVRVDGESLLTVGGAMGGYVIWFSLPRYGRFIFSTRPHPKYEFEQVAVLDNHKIVFNSGGKQFEWIVSEPLVENGTISHLWMMRDRHPEPLKDKPPNGGETGAASHYEYLLPVK